MKDLNDNNFNSEMENSKLVLVDFYATWCAPCGMQSKVLEKMKSSRTLNFDIVKVNVDEAPNLAMKYNVESIPTLMVFKNNELVKKIIGFTSEDELLNIMEELEK